MSTTEVPDRKRRPVEEELMNALRNRIEECKSTGVESPGVTVKTSVGGAKQPEKKAVAKQPEKKAVAGAVVKQLEKKPVTGVAKQAEKKSVAKQLEKNVVTGVDKADKKDVVKPEKNDVTDSPEASTMLLEEATTEEKEDNDESEESPETEGKHDITADEDSKADKKENGEATPAVRAPRLQELDENGERIVVNMHFMMEKLTDIGVLEPFLTNCSSIHVNVLGLAGQEKKMRATLIYRTNLYKKDIEAVKSLTKDGKPLDEFTLTGIPAGVETRVYVYNIPEDTIEEMLRVLFPTAKRVSILKSSDGKSKGCAVLTYASLDEAEKCVQENDEIKIEDDVLKLKIMKDVKKKATTPLKLEHVIGHDRVKSTPTAILKRPRISSSEKDDARPAKVATPETRGRGRDRGRGRGRGRFPTTVSSSDTSPRGRFASSLSSRGHRGRGGLLAHPTTAAMPLMSSLSSQPDYERPYRPPAGSGRGILGANPVISQGPGIGQSGRSGRVSSDMMRTLERQTLLRQKQNLLQQDISNRLLQRANPQSDRQYGSSMSTMRSYQGASDAKLYQSSGYEGGMDSISSANSYGDIGAGDDYDSRYYQGVGRLGGTSSRLSTNTSLFGDYQSGYGPGSSNQDYF